MKPNKIKAVCLLLCFSLLIGLIPSFVSAVEDSQVTNGYYDEEGVWHQSEDNGPLEISVNDHTSLSLSKTAEPTENPNEYLITLTAEVTSTAKVIPAEAAATVLVIDTSGSMDGCASCKSEADIFGIYRHAHKCPCGSGRVAEKDSRICYAKQAALSFLNSFKGTDVSGRYVAIIGFNKFASIKCDWQDITTADGLANAIAAINSLSAYDGTNMQQGLDKAMGLFASNAVESISKDLRNVLVLTDGEPTYYGTKPNGNGSDGSEANNTATANTAADLREIVNALYTVCYGAENQYCYYGGPTVDAFLKNSIASSADCAFNAETVSELNAAFANITQTIVEEADNASGAYVVDPIPPNISASVELDDGEFIWTLGDVEPVISTGSDGILTYTYTYTTSYMITIDADGQGFDESAFYPANGRTTLVWGDYTFDFPVPGIKGTTSRFSVTYNKGEHGTLNDGQETVTYDNVKKWSPTVTEERPAPQVNADEGWRFVGWEPLIAENVEGNATYTAVYEIITHDVTFDANGHGIAPDKQTVEHGKTATKPADPEVEGWTFGGWYTEKECENAFNFAAQIKADLILYAKWTENEPIVIYHTVTFDGNGHGTPPDPAIVEHGQSVGCPADPIADPGWKFIGWYEDEESTTAYEFSKAVLTDITVYAGWTEDPMTPLTHTVAFDANGHGTAPDAQTVEHGKTATKPADPQAEGWTFEGWYTEKECENAFDFAGLIEADVTLYAKWTQNGNIPETPKTGDGSMMELWLGLWLVSGCGLITMAIFRARRRKYGK
ncbi:MAG: InlB B-repeat-containing protein [Clostridia bacterium]|nr:InlB B-repeat-containing protein [Clostridia bacterium]